MKTSRLIAVSATSSAAAAALAIGLLAGSSQTIVPPPPSGQTGVAVYADFPPLHGHYWCVVLGVHDGDTAQLGVIVNLGQCRFLGYDAPELNSERGRDARAALKRKLTLDSIWDVLLDGRDKYGRPLATVYRPYRAMPTSVLDGAAGTINAEMIREGFGRPYGGGKKESD